MSPSLATRLSPRARVLIAREGFVASFSRSVPGTFDPLTNTHSAPTTSEWDGVAMWVKNDQGGTRPTTGVPGTSAQRVVLRTMLLAGSQLATVPRPGDVVAVEGVTYNVASVTNVADTDALQGPLYRVEVDA